MGIKIAVKSRRGLWRVVGAMVAAGPLVVACGTSEVQDDAVQPTEQAIQDATRLAPSVPPPVSVNALMVALVDHASHAIWDVRETPPASDADWEELEYHATQLAVSGTLISMGGTGPADTGWASLPIWQELSQELTDAGTRAIGATRSRSLDALMIVGDNLVQTCETCHEEFKPDLPTEGLVHTPDYMH